ncbi:hypothetical protein GUJ93_ZPchr0001g31679 [Zizania palustris]|uniref:DUF4219 domain-containing protein n=1 Tax=Zizania palustris TaxID=103762 RepID=A0A8J5RBV8_ZIZPA|nr:hypothetical protein GUJ93_ZPchr0001g31679 [Zizania palustris]
MFTHISAIEKFNGDNYDSWRENIEIALAIWDMDLALQQDCPTQPTELVIQDGESQEAFSTRQWEFATVRMKYDIERTKWNQSNRKCLMIIKNSIVEPIRGFIPDCDTAKEYLKKVESQYIGFTKAYASSIIKKLITEKYRGGGVREHILRMSNWASKLKHMDMELPKDFVIHLIMISLSKDFEHFIVRYNTHPEYWTLEKLVSNCVQEEERIKETHGGYPVHHIHHHDKGKRQFSFKKNKTYKHK